MHNIDDHSPLDPPISVIKLGNPLYINLIEEGHDVYFECQIDANPPSSNIKWSHNVSERIHKFNLKNQKI